MKADGGDEYDVFVGAGAIAFVAAVPAALNAVLLASAPNPTPLVVAVWLCGPLLGVLTTGYTLRWSRDTANARGSLRRVAAWMAVGALGLGAAGTAYSSVSVSPASVAANTDAFALWASGGVAAGGLVGVYDAERRLRAAQSELARSEAEELADALTVLNRVLRHDIRNDANVIDGHLETLASETDALDDHVGVARRRVGRIVERADHARKAERVLAAPDERPETDIVPLVERCVADAREQYDDACVVCDTPPSATVRAHGLVTSALWNVLENAVEHNADPEPTVAVTVTVGDCVEITVTDDGPGIPDRELRVFEDGESPLCHSNGMGLWLVRWIVEHSGGEVDFERDDGTRVTVSLPRA